MTFRFAGPITMSNASASLAACVASLDQGEVDIALDSLRHSDSSAVAVLIAARRHAESSGKRLQFTDLPDAVRDLARLYGVEAVIGAKVSSTAPVQDR